jgi:hypothetical protein
LLLANAIYDYELLSKEAVPKLLNLSKFSLRTLFRRKKSGDNGFGFSKHIQDFLSTDSVGKYMFRELNRLKQEKQNASWERLWMGGFGELTLIGPMLLMVLHRDLNTSIITASVATVLFAIFLAVTARSFAGKDILAAVAAYAAVLVVFVSTSMTPIS